MPNAFIDQGKRAITADPNWTIDWSGPDEPWHFKTTYNLGPHSKGLAGSAVHGLHRRRAFTARRATPNMSFNRSANAGTLAVQPPWSHHRPHGQGTTPSSPKPTLR